MKKILLLLFVLSSVYAAPPAGYYDNVAGLSGENLRSVLHDIIDGHTVLSYTPGVWNAYQTTDLKPNGKIWDIYSAYEYTYGTDQAGSYSKEGDVYNREHTWPQGYFDERSPMKSDVHHVYPSDGYVNGKRGSYPFGEVASASYTSTNGSKLGSARSGLGYTGTCFEPIDEYKGDLARTYFYMSTRYYNEDGSWDNWAMADGVELKQWAVDMLLEWHANDPVSSKETNRNDAIYALQKNRNPFIDHPEYVAFIWGDETPDDLPAPVAAAASNIDSTSFDANWASVDGANGYKLYVATDAVFFNTLSAYAPKNLTLLTEKITGLEPDTKYYYKLKAYNDDEESIYSNIIVVTTDKGNGGTVTPPDTGEVGLETFANFPETGSSYGTGTFIGQDAGTWSYTECRGDQEIEAETPCLGKGRTPEASIESSTISGGIVNLSFSYKQAFSTDVSLDVYVNDVFKASVTSDNEQFIIKSSGSIAVNEPGDVVLKFVQTSSASGQVAIDNITWSSYPVSVEPTIPLEFSVGDAYPNPFNPSCTLPLTLEQDSNIKLGLYNILGKEVKNIHNGYMSAGIYSFNIDAKDMPTGMYFIKVDHASGTEMRKVLLLK